ncbi:wax ester/triacylglycerol synthase domain-containing protein [Variovorax sp. dw_954]|uniref:wax ester/triacylglycerol synthase domain-containing protein n=1 Tax=Variovorax sp. dw_954 TaxID=2720078 RepID=UPI001BD6A6D5|nr:wax ester/triacylglycerol synthase domain-containing protein [Variovorax sp. dw_954]
MPALSIIDLAMFVLETPERPFNIGPLILLDPPARGRATFADRLVAGMLKRPPGVPFNYKLRVPMLGMPSLEIDADPDIASHVHRITLAAPGDFGQLSAKVCELHETRLDRSRLLWDLYVIDGLEGGKVALYGKTHHGIIDGRGFVQAISNWLALSDTDRSVRAMWEALPTRAREDGVRASVGQRLTKLLGGVKGTASSAVGVYGMLGQQWLKALGLGAKGMSLPFTGIPRALRGRASSKRSFAFTTLPIRDMKAFGKAHGATLNDLLLVCLDIALARYLRDQGQKPGKALVTAMPIALANADGGNQIAVLQFPLGAPELSARERLDAIHAETETIKSVINKSTNDTVMLYTTLVHGLPALVEKAGLKRGLSVSNLMVSNPFGFPEKRYLMGAPVEMVLPISVVPAGQLLNVTAVSLGERLQIGFLAMPEAVPDIEKLARYTSEAFDDLVRDIAKPAVKEQAQEAPAAEAAPKRPRAPRKAPEGRVVAAKKAARPRARRPAKQPATS